MPVSGLVELAGEVVLPLARKGKRFHLDLKVAEVVWAEHEERMLAKHRVAPGRRRR